jgi:hypothetical protein
MTDIRLRAMTENGRGVALIDADVVQHGRLFEELHVDRQLHMFLDNLQTAVSHLTTVFQQQTTQVIVVRIVFIDDR